MGIEHCRKNFILIRNRIWGHFSINYIRKLPEFNKVDPTKTIVLDPLRQLFLTQRILSIAPGFSQGIKEKDHKGL